MIASNTNGDFLAFVGKIPFGIFRKRENRLVEVIVEIGEGSRTSFVHYFGEFCE